MKKKRNYQRKRISRKKRRKYSYRRKRVSRKKRRKYSYRRDNRKTFKRKKEITGGAEVEVEHVTSELNSFLYEKGREGEWISCSGNEIHTILQNYIDQEIKPTGPRSTGFMLGLLIGIGLGEGRVKIEIDGVDLFPGAHRVKRVGLHELEETPTLIDQAVERHEDLNGKWEDDKGYISIEIQEGGGGEFMKREKGSRLIIGGGPSASGKTHWARNLIELFIDADEHFPKFFLSIDGGLFRELSRTYNGINRIIHRHPSGIRGLEELGSKTGAWGRISPLFDTDSIKKELLDFLELQVDKSSISLYIPETFTGCSTVMDGLHFSCIDSGTWKKWMNITNDNNWIFILIWQHMCPQEGPCTVEGYRTATEPTQGGGDQEDPPPIGHLSRDDDALLKELYNMDPKCKLDIYKCEGCIKSGVTREITEGKEYSPSTWGRAMTNSRKIIRAVIDWVDPSFFRKLFGAEPRPGRPLAFEVHNSGTVWDRHKGNKSIFIDYNIESPFKDPSKRREYMHYINWNNLGAPPFDRAVRRIGSPMTLSSRF